MSATLAPAPAPVVLPKPRPPMATLDDLDACTCSVPLDGTRPHYLYCDLRYGVE
jgi:hypothetical protein